MRIADLGRVVTLGAALFIGGCGDCDTPEPPSPSAQAAQAYLAKLASTPYDIGVVRELGEYEVVRFREKASGDAYAVFGSKDANGKVVDIQQMTRTDKAGVMTTVDYHANGDRSFTGANGVQLDLRRQEGGQWLAEFRDPSSGASFRTNLPGPATAARQAGDRQLAVLVAGPPSTANQVIANVFTSNCGAAADPFGQRVSVDFISGSGARLGNYPAIRTGTGTYRSAVPNPDREAGISIEFLGGALTALDTALGRICEIDKQSPLLALQTCSYISAQMALTGIAAPIAAQFLTLCDGTVLALQVTCVIKAAIDLPFSADINEMTAGTLPSLAGFLIDKLPKQILSPTLVALVGGLEGNIYGPQVALANFANAVDLRLDLFYLNVGDIVLAPPAPAAPRQYTATAALQCLAPGTNATIEVRGSDGYVNEQQQSYATVTNSATITLIVPGAKQAGIRDTLTLTVMPPNTSGVVRTAYLVFQ